ncbi:YceI family protein [Massilibacteroides sp.]|uniref:YceI family protein n=1 Tax=Massilibacteroides sp. TaxID=2034766 RepID=UPI002633C629|nr:YceI family protein [Massilibacteroides sp.]MDD4516496.1 YceI family protein [Massilibacteroides sp.]
MKAYNYLIAIALIVLATACGGKSSGQKVEASAAKEVAVAEGKTLSVDLSASVINWKGFKPAGSHHGILSIKSGELYVDGDQLKSGNFVLDMTSINVQDLESGQGKEKLEGHLKSADFFDVENYPEGKFTITGVEVLSGGEYTHRISGNLTLKDVEKNISFDAKITNNGDTYTATTATFTIDRTQWGVNYGSKNIFKDLKDSFINDEMEISITLVAKE